MDFLSGEAKTEESIPSIEQDLATIFDESVKEDQTEPEHEEPTETSEETEETAEATEDEGEATEPTEDEDGSEEDGETAEGVEPPDSWSQEAKEAFKEAAPAIQEQIAKREKEFKVGLQKNAEDAKFGKQIEQIVSPYRAMIQAEGGDVPSAIQDLLNTAYVLRNAGPEQKKQLFTGLARQFGVDLSEFQSNNEPDEEFVDPEVKKLRAELNQLKQQNEYQVQSQRQAQVQELQAQIQAFASDPKNEHFEKVKHVMSGLLQSGAAKTLQDAYDQAVWADPDIRTKLSKKKSSEAELKKRKDQKAKSEQKKKAAGTQVKGDDVPGTKSSKEMSWDEELGAVFDAMQED